MREATAPDLGHVLRGSRRAWLFSHRVLSASSSAGSSSEPFREGNGDEFRAQAQSLQAPARTSVRAASGAAEPTGADVHVFTDPQGQRGGAGTEAPKLRPALKPFFPGTTSGANPGASGASLSPLPHFTLPHSMPSLSTATPAPKTLHPRRAESKSL